MLQRVDAGGPGLSSHGPRPLRVASVLGRYNEDQAAFDVFKRVFGDESEEFRDLARLPVLGPGRLAVFVDGRVGGRCRV